MRDHIIRAYGDVHCEGVLPALWSSTQRIYWSRAIRCRSVALDVGAGFGGFRNGFSITCRQLRGISPVQLGFGFLGHATVRRAFPMDVRMSRTDTTKCFAAHDAKSSMAPGTVSSREGVAAMVHCVPTLPYVTMCLIRRPPWRDVW